METTGTAFAPGPTPWHLAAHVREVPLHPSLVPCACLVHAHVHACSNATLPEGWQTKGCIVIGVCELNFDQTLCVCLLGQKLSERMPQTALTDRRFRPRSP